MSMLAFECEARCQIQSFEYCPARFWAHGSTVQYGPLTNPLDAPVNSLPHRRSSMTQICGQSKVANSVLIPTVSWHKRQSRISDGRVQGTFFFMKWAHNQPSAVRLQTTYREQYIQLRFPNAALQTAGKEKKRKQENT